MFIILCIHSIFCIPPSSLYQFFSISTILCMLVCMYVCMGDIRAAIYFCFIFLCVSNIWTQCMVCMYLIDAYCCDTEWMDCIDEGFSVRSHYSGRATTKAWS